MRNVNFYTMLSFIQMYGGSVGLVGCFLWGKGACGIEKSLTLIYNLRNSFILQHSSVRHWMSYRRIYKENISKSYYNVMHWCTCLPMEYFSACATVHVKLTTTIYYLMDCVINGIYNILISPRFLLNPNMVREIHCVHFPHICFFFYCFQWLFQ